MTNTSGILVSTGVVVGIVVGAFSSAFVNYLRHRLEAGQTTRKPLALAGILLGGVIFSLGVLVRNHTVVTPGVTANQDTSVQAHPSRGAMGHMETHVDTGVQPAQLSKQQIQWQQAQSARVLHEVPLKPTILKDGTKRYTLTASAFPWHLYSGQTFMAWGYNHQVPGPLLRFQIGDRVEIVVHNQLPDNTTVHWHGFAVPNSMDGIPGVTQNPIKPGSSYTYKFTVTPQMIGTHWYHSHVNDDFQIDQGLRGPIIVDSKPTTSLPRYDVDALYQLGSFKVGGSEAENVFTMDGLPFPTDPQLNVKINSRVRIRFINSSAEETHVMHLHGYTFQVVAVDGNPVAHPQAQNTVMLGPSQTVDVAFTANNKGRWMLHCHLADHMMNPEDYMDDMGGLVTYVNVK